MDACLSSRRAGIGPGRGCVGARFGSDPRSLRLSSPGAGVKAGPQAHPRRGLGLDAGEDDVIGAGAGNRGAWRGSGWTKVSVSFDDAVKADMRGLVTAGPCVRLGAKRLV